MRFEWNRPLGLTEAPYIRRWAIPLLGGWSLRLMHWLGNDDPDALHDHEQWFWSFVIRGSYTDVTLNGREQRKAGSLAFRSASHTHTVQDVQPNTWTLTLWGGPKRRWSFWHKARGKMKRDKYFAEIGHHTASSTIRIRIRPDGTQIIAK